MKTEQRTVYVTDDGTEFAEERLALRHEQVQVLRAYLIRTEGPVYWREPDAGEVAQDLINGYVVIQRHVAEDLHAKLATVRKFLEDTLDVPDLVGRVEEVQKHLKT